jgi:hypothetical protein
MYAFLRTFDKKKFFWLENRECRNRKTGESTNSTIFSSSLLRIEDILLYFSYPIYVYVSPLCVPLVSLFSSKLEDFPPIT